jgi:hypothetical protein
MIRLIAILAFFLAIILNAWSVKHGAITWQLLALIGLFFWCISSAWDRTPW